MTNDDLVGAMLQDASRSETWSPAPPQDLLALAHKARSRRRLLQSLTVSSIAMVVVAGGGAAALGLGPLDRASVAEPGGGRTSLTQQQFDDALSTAHWAEHEFGDNVTGATAIARDGVVTQSNTGTTCTSGRLIEVTVYGSFHVVTGGRFDPEGNGTGQDDPVTSVIVTLDGASGQRCLTGVSTGQPTAEPGAQLLFGEAP